MLSFLRGLYNRIFKQRIYTIRWLFIVVFIILIFTVFKLQIIKGNKYQENFSLKIQKTKQIAATRGNIYDRNGELLAYNDLAYSVTIEDDGTYDNITTENRNQKLNNTIKDTIKIIEDNGDRVISDFGIYIDKNGNYQFEADTSLKRKRFLADVYGYAKIEDLSPEQESSSPDDVMNYLTSDKRYDLKNITDKSLILKIINIRYLMTQKSYTKYIATTIATDVNEKTVAVINESKGDYPGIDIVEDSIRRYEDSYAFSSVLGYLGTISDDEYNNIDFKNKNKYSLQSVVGKAGIEQVMDTTLQGTPGEETLFVNSVGRVLLTTDVTNPIAGNNVYLSIDKNVQKYAYDVLEREIAGIVVNKLIPDINYDPSTAEDTSNIKIPAGDVYSAFFTNGILDVNKLAKSKENNVEQKVHNYLLDNEKESIDLICNQMHKNAVARKDYDDKLEELINYYLRTFLTSKGVFDEDNIEVSDEIYSKWSKEKSISLREYISYGVSRNWFNLKKIGISSNYSGTDEIINKLIKYTKKNITGEYNLDIICYKYMVKTGIITGADVCAMAIEQGIFPDNGEYAVFSSGAGDAFEFIKNKIFTLELTPGRLGVEPCSGSVMVTDPNNGDVLACVSYPGYDSNRLSDNMDKQYYRELVLNSSKPLYNHATQERTAPGSTYKMVTSIAGLETDTIGKDTVLECTGEFEAVSPSPKCWIYPGMHGGLSLPGAISNSCNCYFYQVGWKLSEDDNVENIKDNTQTNDNSDESNDEDNDSNNTSTKIPHSNIRGLSTLKKYATEFGLSDVSGLELPESKPEISDEDSVRSAIGQGTNNFTLSQMSVYVTAIASEGKVYNYSLIKKVEDNRGKKIGKHGSKVRKKMKVKSKDWSSIKTGMNDMVLNSSQFYNTFTDAGGKTGTAQESKKHPDNVLFIGYTPAQEPKYSIAVRIKNGYTSSYAAEIANKLMRLYNNASSPDDLIGGTAYHVGESTRND